MSIVLRHTHPFDRVLVPSFVDRVLGPTWAREAWTREPATAHAWSPAVDIGEDEKSYRLLVDLPSLTKEDVEVGVEDGVLTLSGERRAREADDKTRWHRTERTPGKFRRAFTLPDDVATEAIQATFKDGVLEVVLPKNEVRAAAKRTIAIA